MVKIIGNALFVVLLFVHCFIHSSIKLEVRTYDGIATETVVIGQPFLIEVSIDGIQGSVQEPKIEGTGHFTCRRTGMYMSTINGHSTTKFSYQSQIDKAGTYSIGPARAIYKNQTLVSNAVVITAGTDVITNVAKPGTKKSRTTNTHVPAFLRLAVDTRHVVVGQKIVASLRFYYQDMQISLLNIGQPDLVAFNVQEAGDPVGGVENINGVTYRYAEWNWCMYPKVSGEFTVPAYSANYESPVQDAHALGGLFMFMHVRTDRKRVYSNALKIMVDPLPAHDGKVDAIGTFDSINAKIKPAVAKLAEGMVLEVEIEGDGNWHALKSLNLVMPAALKYYDSNSSLVDLGSGKARKKFEFIVQGMEAGEWEIPKQVFTYFDSKKHKYVTLHTSPLSVSIKPNNNVSRVDSVSCKQEVASEEKINDNIKHTPECIPLNEAGRWYDEKDVYLLPWLLFYVLVCVPLLCMAYTLFLRYIDHLTGNVSSLQKRRAFKTARTALKSAVIRGDVTRLYIIFDELIKSCNKCLFLQDGANGGFDCYLQEHGFSGEELVQWKVFYERITQVAYAQPDGSNNNELLKMAGQWLERLEKVT